MAVAEYGHFALLRDRLEELGVDPEEAMEPFVAALRGLPRAHRARRLAGGPGQGVRRRRHRRRTSTARSRRTSTTSTRELVLEVLDRHRALGFAVDRVRAAIEADPGWPGGWRCGGGGWSARR